MTTEYNRKDRFYHKAKEEGFNSRAAYKLIEIDQKFKLFKPGQRVLDLGCWPGGWLQVVAEKIGVKGLAVGIDLKQMDPFAENIKIITGDAREEENLKQALIFAGQKFDLVLSDMSPNTTGIKEADRMAAVNCAELAIWVAEQVLKTGGNLIVKVFKSSEIDGFVKSNRTLFNKLSRIELESTRKTSNEYYLVGLGYKIGAK